MPLYFIADFLWWFLYEISNLCNLQAACADIKSKYFLFSSCTTFLTDQILCELDIFIQITLCEIGWSKFYLKTLLSFFLNCMYNWKFLIYRLLKANSMFFLDSFEFNELFVQFILQCIIVGWSFEKIDLIVLRNV